VPGSVTVTSYHLPPRLRPDRNSSALADLNPGDSVETAVVFDVPKGTDVESIELHDGPFSDGVTVGL
jgi:hypothetical protein